MNDDTPTAFSRVRAFFRLATAERDGQQCALIQSENTLRFERADKARQGKRAFRFVAVNRGEDAEADGVAAAFRTER